MKEYFNSRKYRILPLILCLFFSLGAELPPSVFTGAPPIPRTDKTATTDGEGLFERMIIDKITSMETNLKELTRKVEDIEKRLYRIERGLVSRPGGGSETAGGTPSLGGGTASAPQEPPKKRLKSQVPKEKDIEEGLRVIEVDYHGTGEKGENTFFMGKMENNTVYDIGLALFKIEVYGEQGNLLGIESFEIKDVLRAWPKKFSLLIYKVDADLIADYTIKRLK